MEKLLFTELQLSDETLKAVSDMGFEEATPIQSLSIPMLLEGRDVIGQAQTGTGKTAAFGIPILERLNIKNKSVQAIVLCPTRELAIQVAEEMHLLAKHKKGLKVLPVYGGQPIDRQIRSLKQGTQIVIGTPGRVRDHLRRRTLKLGDVKTIVLDEADEMLDMGFRDDIEGILENIPKERQTVFFSATMPKAFMSLTKKYQNEPKHVKIAHGKLSAPDIEQIYFETKERLKLELFSRVMDLYNLKLVLVFCNTKRKVDDVVEHLKVRGYFCDGIHGDLRQQQRDKVMAKFRSGKIEILVATDVAARGIDVDDIEAVFNYDMPQHEEYYVHRIGRTGRAGKSGYSFTFASGKDMYKLKSIQRYTNVTIQRKPVPSVKDVEEIRVSQFFEKAKALLETKDVNMYTNMIEHIIGDEYTSLDVAGALLMMLMKDKPVVGKQGNKTKTISDDTMARIFMRIGRDHSIQPGEIIKFIAGEVGMSGSLVGSIDIHETFTFVEVPESYADKVVEILSKKRIKGKKIDIERAK